MPELGFRDQSSSSSSATTSAGRRFRGGDASPDSVIFTLESNLSFFSSASASVDRCSFASDAHDHDSLASEISLHLAGHEYDREQQESPSGPDPDPDPNKPVIHLNRHRKGEKVKALKDESDIDVALDSARSSFSLALRECQEKRSRSEALPKKLDRRRPASLDLNNVTASSPRLGNIKKASLASRKSGNFPSPGTPNYRLAGAGMQKGWSSERVASHTGSARKQQSSALLLNGKTLPSKWEDAERWIFSPVSGDGALRSSYNNSNSQQPQRRPKSKSGPLGPPGVAYNSLYSPAMPMFEGCNVGNFSAASPFSAGVIGADGLAMRQSSGRHSGGFSARADPCMARSVSVHGCSEMTSLSSALAHQGVKDAATNVSRAVLRRDMATQMSPEGSPDSSPKHGHSFADAIPSNTITPTVEMESGPSCRLEVRDVQVDERVTMTRWSNKRRSRIPGKSSEMFESWKKKDAAWDISNVPKSISKVQRKEAKITAWENLQKAKAEAATLKLEMKLEKKRSSSMDKIMKKLKSAQNRAQEMRSSMLTNQTHPVPRNSTKALSFRRTTQKMSSLSGCFTCPAF